MHELPIVREILRTSLNYAQANDATHLHEIVLGVGELHDMAEEWVERYFEFASKGTIAEGAVIKINRYPVICCCKSCGENNLIHLHTMDKVACGACGSTEYDIISGKQMQIENISIT